MDQDRQRIGFPETEEEKREPAGPDEWDGSEAELVADDDASEYEDQNTGFRLSYTLKEQEILKCLKTTDLCRTSGKRAAVESVILIVLSVVFFASYFRQNYNQQLLVFGIISLLLIAVIWIVPAQGLKRKARELADGKEICLKIYPDSLEVEKGGSVWEIPLDGTSRLEKQEKQLVVHTPGGRMLVLPLRSIEPSALPEIQAMLVAGTLPFTED